MALTILLRMWRWWDLITSLEGRPLIIRLKVTNQAEQLLRATAPPAWQPAVIRASNSQDRKLRKVLKSLTRSARAPIWMIVSKKVSINSPLALTKANFHPLQAPKPTAKGLPVLKYLNQVWSYSRSLPKLTLSGPFRPSIAPQLSQSTTWNWWRLSREWGK